MPRRAYHDGRLGEGPGTRKNRKTTSPTPKTRYVNYFRFASAILGNGGNRLEQPRTVSNDRSTTKNNASDAKIARGKVLPVWGRHLGKWRKLVGGVLDSPKQPKNHESDAINVLRKLLPVCGRHLGK